MLLHNNVMDLGNVNFAIENEMQKWERAGKAEKQCIYCYGSLHFSWPFGEATALR